MIICFHVWYPTKAKYQYSQYEQAGSIINPLPFSRKIDIYLVTLKCLKCGKKKKELQRFASGEL